MSHFVKKKKNVVFPVHASYALKKVTLVRIRERGITLIYHYWAIPFEFKTPPVEDLRNIFHTRSAKFQVDSSFGTSEKDIYPLCDKPI